MSLDPIIRQRVAHLYGKSLRDLLAGKISEPAAVATEDVANVEALDREIAGRHGPIPVRVYTAGDRPDPTPAMVWCHGGAWMAGDLDMAEADAVSRRIAAGVAGIVVSVDYRLAPAHTYPVPLDDVVEAFEATACGPLAREFAIDGDRVALGGTSAGGDLAASAALVLADRGVRRAAALLLAYPATNPVDGPWPDETRPEECPELLWFDGTWTPGIFSIYLGGAEPVSPAVPALGDLSGRRPDPGDDRRVRWPQCPGGAIRRSGWRGGGRGDATRDSRSLPRLPRHGGVGRRGGRCGPGGSHRLASWSSVTAAGSASNRLSSVNSGRSDTGQRELKQAPRSEALTSLESLINKYLDLELRTDSDLETPACAGGS